MLKPATHAQHAPLLSLFERFLSPINARAIVRSVIERAGTNASNEQLFRQATASSAIYVKPEQRDALLKALRELLLTTAVAPKSDVRADVPASPPVEPRATLSLTIRAESDLNEARLIARQMCRQAGLDGFSAQKLVTAVSELARNVAKYASPGRVSFIDDASQRKLRVTVADTGAGIPNLDEVMRGKYRSKTGMGLGLIGTKKLVDEFDINTGPGGTTITIAVRY